MLAESKSPLDAEMVELLTSLLDIVKVAVISGVAWPHFEKQVLANLPHHARLEQLSILPTCGTKFYQFVVRDPQETKRVTEAISACLSDTQVANPTEVSYV